MSMDGEPLVSRFTQAVNDAIDRYRDEGLTVAEALGALDLVHGQILKDALEESP